MKNVQEKMLRWLRQRVAHAARVQFLGAFLFALLALLLMLVTFVVIYAAQSFCFFLRIAVPTTALTRALIAAAVVLATFLLSFLSPPRFFEKISVTTNTPGKRPRTYLLPAIAVASNISSPAPEHMNLLLKMLLILNPGPRAFFESMRMFLLGRRIQKIRPEPCATVLRLLARKGRRVPFEDVVDAIPEGYDEATTIADLSLIEGVLVLQAPPAGLALSPELLEQYNLARQRFLGEA